MEQCAKKKKKLKQLEYDKEQTYYLLEALCDQPFFLPTKTKIPILDRKKKRNQNLN